MTKQAQCFNLEQFAELEQRPNVQRVTTETCSHKCGCIHWHSQLKMPGGGCWVTTGQFSSSLLSPQLFSWLQISEPRRKQFPLVQWNLHSVARKSRRVRTSTKGKKHLSESFHFSVKMFFFVLSGQGLDITLETNPNNNWNLCTRLWLHTEKLCRFFFEGSQKLFFSLVVKNRKGLQPCSLKSPLNTKTATQTPASEIIQCLNDVQTGCIKSRKCEVKFFLNKQVLSWLWGKKLLLLLAQLHPLNTVISQHR